ncbi:radical SAM protein [Streptomyces sp. RLB3-17]|uniref:radical SAM protein n=1 Tax=Streptomyces sp. RLB3-17 TaxID=2594455 RepID=UPI0011633E5E|nr:radical SAM protein [Streptomyces sp. RLB3-17]QDO43361.1 radical SAM protein [Streptomyces sp. RLB3-17]
MKSNLHPYLRIVVNHSKTCNMHCVWCHEEGMQRTSPGPMLTPAQIVSFSRILYETGVRKFKIVGGEPTLRQDLPEILSGLRQIDPALDLSMVTNGSRLASLGEAYKEAGINRVNVSLFSLNPEFFRENVGPASLMSRVVSGIDRTASLGILGKINHVFQDMGTLHDILAFARERSVRVNVLNRIPSLSSRDGMPISQLLEKLATLPVESVTEEIDPYSLPVKVMKLEGGGEIEVKHLEIGAQQKFLACHTCQVKEICKEGIFALRITPIGKLQPCIVREDNSFDLTSNPSVESVKNYLEGL